MTRRYRPALEELRGDGHCDADVEGVKQSQQFAAILGTHAMPPTWTAIDKPEERLTDTARAETGFQDSWHVLERHRCRQTSSYCRIE